MTHAPWPCRHLFIPRPRQELIPDYFCDKIMLVNRPYHHNPELEQKNHKSTHIAQQVKEIVDFRFVHLDFLIQNHSCLIKFIWFGVNLCFLNDFVYSEVKTRNQGKRVSQERVSQVVCMLFQLKLCDILEFWIKDYLVLHLVLLIEWDST